MPSAGPGAARARRSPWSRPWRMYASRAVGLGASGCRARCRPPVPSGWSTSSPELARAWSAGQPLELRAVVAVEAHDLARGEHAPVVGLRVVAEPGRAAGTRARGCRARCRSRAARSSRRRRRRRRARSGGCRCPCGTRPPRGPRGRTRPSPASGSGPWRRAPSPGRSARPPGAAARGCERPARGPRARSSFRVSRSLAATSTCMPSRPVAVWARICVSPAALSRSALACASGRPALSSSTMPSIRSGSTPASAGRLLHVAAVARHPRRRGARSRPGSSRTRRGCARPPRATRTRAWRLGRTPTGRS